MLEFVGFIPPPITGLSEEAVKKHLYVTESLKPMLMHVQDRFGGYLKTEVSKYSDDNPPQKSKDTEEETLDGLVYEIITTKTTKKPGWKGILEELQTFLYLIERSYNRRERPTGIATLDETPYISSQLLMNVAIDLWKKVDVKGVRQEVKLKEDTDNLTKAADLTKNDLSQIVIPYSTKGNELESPIYFPGDGIRYVQVESLLNTIEGSVIEKMAQIAQDFMPKRPTAVKKPTEYDTTYEKVRASVQFPDEVMRMTQSKQKNIQYARIFAILFGEEGKKDIRITGEIEKLIEEPDSDLENLYRPKRRKGIFYVPLEIVKRRLTDLYKDTVTYSGQPVFQHIPLFSTPIWEPAKDVTQPAKPS